MSFRIAETCHSNLSRLPHCLKIELDESFNPIIHLVLRFFFFYNSMWKFFVPFYENSKDRNKKRSLKSAQHKVTFKQSAVSHCELPAACWGRGGPRGQGTTPCLGWCGGESVLGEGVGALARWLLMGLSTWKIPEIMSVLPVSQSFSLTWPLLERLNWCLPILLFIGITWEDLKTWSLGPASDQ